jgi:hypothetical protein
MKRALVVIVLVLLARPSHSEVQRVRIPGACRELANRAGLPPTLTPAEAARAVAYLRLIISQDPEVKRCQHGVIVESVPYLTRTK